MGMIERVARAIASKTCPSSPMCEPTDQCSCRESARAAIAAMREPSEEMVQAAVRTTGGFPKTAWHAMIDSLVL